MTVRSVYFVETSVENVQMLSPERVCHTYCSVAATKDQAVKRLPGNAELVIPPSGKGSSTVIKAEDICNCVSPGDFVKMQTLNL